MPPAEDPSAAAGDPEQAPQASPEEIEESDEIEEP